MLSTAIVAVGIDDRITQHLTDKGYSVETACDIASSLHRRMAEKPAGALILGTAADLDDHFARSQQSKLDGCFVRGLRESRIDTPVIKIAKSPRDEFWAQECAYFLNCGGDDVIAGPPDPQEVEFVIQAIHRRMQHPPDRIERFACTEAVLEINVTKERITINRRRISATPYEAKILVILASSLKVVSRRTFNQQLGWETPTNRTSLDVLIWRIRRLLGNAARLIETRPGVGYELIGRVH